MTSDFPLKVAARITKLANAAWSDGRLLAQVTPLTAELLRYWFAPEFMERRAVNFHSGQRQAILNTVYLHEVRQCRNVSEVYALALQESSLPALSDKDCAELSLPKYAYPKYCMKMATGTGKTWVMHALMIWQALNARREVQPSGRFTQRFLVVAPGLIVYDRLLDAYLGRVKADTGLRDSNTSDFYRQQELFLPERYRQEMFAFLQNNTVTKGEIGRRTTGDGLIALTNWHLFLQESATQQELETELADETQIDARVEEWEALTSCKEKEAMAAGKLLVKQLLPLRPGTATGNALDVLDARFLRGREMDYLRSLPDLMIINDEAHHIHDNKGEEDVKWQQGLDYIASGKTQSFAQIDFSATPYVARSAGRGNKKTHTKDYFRHLVVDFSLEVAMQSGLVKTLLIDRRQNFLDQDNADLDFRAYRDESGKVLGLSPGQRTMLRAGWQKLRNLERDFARIDSRKRPKMLVMCEDTKVTPFVEDFFVSSEGIAPDEVLRIDSDRKGEMKDEEWVSIKERLFNVDAYEKPRIIISVLMLREGFDVSNICVIVPLRASTAPILLEQTIGRGLRLMWREPEYQEEKVQNRQRVVNEGLAPHSMLDMLTIVEHPAFEHFYKELMDEGLAHIDTRELSREGESTGDLMRVPLRDNYQRYALAWPLVVSEAEEELEPLHLKATDLAPYTDFSLAKLQQVLATEGETFVSQEIVSETLFGTYKVGGQLFDATSYNEYLGRLISAITTRHDRVGRKHRALPPLQVDHGMLLGVIDQYVRQQLFEMPFDPMQGNGWKILLAKSGHVTRHIVGELSAALYRNLQYHNVSEALVEWLPFEQVLELRMRESSSLALVKTIYERTHFASASSGLERHFAQWIDRESSVERWIKIDEYAHSFACIFYLRSDGLLARYYPDFMVETATQVLLIETKADRDVEQSDVQKKKAAAADWCRRINALPSQQRRNREWDYLLVSESLWSEMQTAHGTLSDLCARARWTVELAEERLF